VHFRLEFSDRLLAVWFGIHVLLPNPGQFDLFATLASLAAFVAMIRFKLDIIPVVIASACLGLLFKTVAPALFL
jgi:chromate transporter